MLHFEFRPSARLVTQIATIERYCGNWDRLASTDAAASDERRTAAMRSGAQAIVALDASCSGSLEDAAGRINSAALDNLRLSLERLRSLLSDLEPSIESVSFRSNPDSFVAPATGLAMPTDVFRTVSPFLIEKRCNELLAWTNQELEMRTFHPLVVIGVFHLLFLQIHPFVSANHRLSLLAVWQLMRRNGYQFVEFQPIAPYFLRHRERYFKTLRQAEKSALGNWNSVGVWLEFFLEAVADSISTLVTSRDRIVEAKRLTPLQQQIVQIVKTHGPVTREVVVDQTGMNESTVKYNLSVLAKKGHLQRRGGGRTTNYSV